jgi:hypothetical protein
VTHSRGDARAAGTVPARACGPGPGGNKKTKMSKIGQKPSVPKASDARSAAKPATSSTKAVVKSTVNPTKAPTSAAPVAAKKAAGKPTPKASASASKKSAKPQTNDSQKQSSVSPAVSEVKPQISEAELQLRNGKVLVRYNHYKEEFEIVNGRLAIAEVDDRLCLSFAFPKCRLHLTDTDSSQSPNAEEDATGSAFLDLQSGKTYWVLVEEDAEEAKLSEERNRAYVERRAKQRDEPGQCSCSTEKRKVALLTEELKQLSAEELREAGPRYKELLAARDLEDCLFS